MYIIEAPDVARKARAGQFVILRVDEEGERVPLTIADFDREAGTITIVVQEIGKSTRLLGTLSVGDELASFTGPLGRPTEIEPYGTVVLVGGGLGVAPIFPICRPCARPAITSSPSSAPVAAICCSGKTGCAPSPTN
jgi:ferredoxin--NADP+ reductase